MSLPASTLVALLATALAGGGLLLRLRQPTPRVRRITGLVAAGFALLALGAWRWPALVSPEEYNPDESQLIAGALTLAVDPVFWRSVDGTTSGPLNFYALLPLLSTGWPPLLAARLTALLLAGTALVLTGVLLHRAVGSGPALMACLPLGFFLALTTDADFVHYSSEHLSLALLAGAALLLYAGADSAAATGRPGRGDPRLWAGLVLAGLLPWAKPQSGPLAVALIAIAALRLARATPGRGRALAWVGVAALAPSLLALALVIGTGQFRDFLESYLLNNFAYTANQESLGQAIADLARLTSLSGSFPAWLLAVGGLAGVGGLAACISGQRPGPAAGVTLLLFLAAAATVLAPRLGAPHYLLYLLLPGTWLAGVAARAGWQAGRFARAGLLAIVIGPGVLLPLGLRVASDRGPAAAPAPPAISRLADAVGALALPGDRLAIWGWAPRLHVDTRLPQGTRDGNAYRQIQDAAQRERYYRPRYLADFRIHQPAVFVDAVGPGAFQFDHRPYFDHETFPELAAEIAADYRLVADALGARLYVRRDLLATRPGSRRRLEAAVRDLHAAGLTVAPLPPSPLPVRTVLGREVLHLQTPAEITWDLQGDEREFFLTYGIEPEAYLRGSTNGADLVIELARADGGVQPLQAHRLDPRRRPEDRGLQEAAVPLPPLRAGDRLRVRALPGENEDAAWDWVFVTSPRFARSLAP